VNQERITQFMRNFPDEAQILEMEPEELGPFILRYFRKPGSTLNRFNFYQSVPGGKVTTRFAEAWSWLEREGFIALKGTDQFGLEYFVTRKGEEIVSEEDFEAYMQAALFPNDLDAEIMRAVKPLFLRGDYDTAVFRAFKEVEVRVRKKTGLAKEYGRVLMQKAFGPPGILITGDGTNNDDQSALRELFCGAISFYKNRSSHHEVQFENPREVIDMISFANQLLRIVGRLSIRS
jgi:uncharacterized protein (TIGR02391 family)